MKTQPKNPKVSLRNKYKRRLANLASAIDEVEYFANERLAHGGAIHGRKKVEELLVALATVKKLLPAPPKDNSSLATANLSALFNI